MRVLKILGLIPGLLVVLLGGAIALSPARQYLPELGSRATESVASTPAAPVVDLTAVSQLQTAFNASDGSPRLVVLLSPT